MSKLRDFLRDSGSEMVPNVPLFSLFAQSGDVGIAPRLENACLKTIVYMYETLERVTGIEPVTEAWEAYVTELPEKFQPVPFFNLI